MTAPLDIAETQVAATLATAVHFARSRDFLLAGVCMGEAGMVLFEMPHHERVRGVALFNALFDALKLMQEARS